MWPSRCSPNTEGAVRNGEFVQLLITLRGVKALHNVDSFMLTHSGTDDTSGAVSGSVSCSMTL